MARRYKVGETRFRVNTKYRTKRYGHVGTLAGSKTNNGHTLLTLEFEEKGETHLEEFPKEDLQRVFQTTPE